MRVTVVACAILLLLAGLSGSATAIGLHVERLENPNLVQCPRCGKPIRPGGIHEAAEAILATEFSGSLVARDIPYTGEKGPARYLDVFVYRFEERQGGNFSVQRPASLGFHVHLYDGSALVKAAVFDETQQPLSENILRFFTFIRRGAKWITAEALAREGVHKTIQFLGEDLKGGVDGR